MPNISDWPNVVAASSLSQVLETGLIPQRYFLSPTACAGILRRAENRGKTLPTALQAALKAALLAGAKDRLNPAAGLLETAGGEAGGQGGPECGVEPIAFHPSQDPISSTCGTSHGLGCGSSRGQASVAVAVALRGRDGGATAEMDDDLVMYGVPTAPKQADAGSLAPTLRAMGHAGSHANGGGRVAVAIRMAQTGSNGWGVNTEGTAYTLDSAQQAVAVTGGVFHTLRAEGFDASEDGTGRGTGAVAVGVALAIHENQRAEVTLNETAGTVKCAGGKPGQGYPAVLTSMAVRRVTPCECERLMGFPDGYTAIPYRGKSADQCPDGPRYKSLGNSWPVPVVAWIGARIQAQVAVSAQA